MLKTFSLLTGLLLISIGCVNAQPTPAVNVQFPGCGSSSTGKSIISSGGAFDCSYGTQRVIARLLTANFNSTGDQAISVLSSTKYFVTNVLVTNCSASLTLAAGGFYPSPSKGGTPIVAAAQVYSALTGSAAQLLGTTLAAATNTTALSGQTIYFALTLAQGSAATCDIYIVGVDLG